MLYSILRCFYRFLGVAIVLLALVCSVIRWAQPQLPSSDLDLSFALRQWPSYGVKVQSIGLFMRGFSVGLSFHDVEIYTIEKKTSLAFFEKVQLIPDLMQSLFQKEWVWKNMVLEGEACDPSMIAIELSGRGLNRVVSFSGSQVSVPFLKKLMTAVSLTDDSMLKGFSDTGVALYLQGGWKPFAKDPTVYLEGHLKEIGWKALQGIGGVFRFEKGLGTGFVYSDTMLGSLSALQKAAAKLNFVYDPLGLEVAVSDIQLFFKSGAVATAEARFSWNDQAEKPESAFWMYAKDSLIQEWESLFKETVPALGIEGTLQETVFVQQKEAYQGKTAFKGIDFHTDILGVHIEEGTALFATEGSCVHAQNIRVDRQIYQHLESSWTTEEDNILIDSFSLKGPTGSVHAEAKLALSEGQTMQVKGRIHSKDIGSVLSDIHLYSGLQKASGSLSADVVWEQGSLDHILQTMQGEAHFHADEGILEDTHLDAGKALSLLSFSELIKNVRALFSKEQESYYKVREVQGDFFFKKGNMLVKPLKVLSEQADIIATGSVHFADRKIEGEIAVDPHITSSIPVVAIAGIANPALGAALWVFNTVIGKQIAPFSIFHYQLGGTLDHLEVGSVTIKSHKE